MRREGRPTVFAGRSRSACGEAILPLFFGTAFLFLLIGEELLEVRFFVWLIEELPERAVFLFNLAFLLLQLFKLSTEAVDPAGLFFQFAISLGKKSINDFLTPLQNGLFRKSLFLLFDDAPCLRQHRLEIEERGFGQFFVAAEITLGFASLLLVSPFLPVSPSSALLSECRQSLSRIWNR